MSAQTVTSFKSRSISLIDAIGLFLVALVVVWLLVNLWKEPAAFATTFLNGLTLGLVYGLIALGYSLVYGILELINFANGDVFMLGSWVTFSVAVGWFGLDDSNSLSTLIPALLVTLLCAMAFCAALNTGIERIAYRPLRHAPRLAPLITAIGMSFILQNVGLNRLGPAPVSLPDILSHEPVFDWHGVEYDWYQLIVGVATLPVLAMLMWLVQRTKQGKAMRATAQDQDAAAMMGINVNGTISFTFLIAGALAGVAGMFYALYTTNIQFDQGFRLGLIAFTAAVLGGIGNLPGAVLGAIIIGLIQQFNEALGWMTPGPDWTQSIVFSILILILVFRPGGPARRTDAGGRVDAEAAQAAEGPADGPVARAAAAPALDDHDHVLRDRRDHVAVVAPGVERHPADHRVPDHQHGRDHGRLRDHGGRPQHRGRLRGPARPRLRRLLRDGRLHRGLAGLAAVLAGELPLLVDGDVGHGRASTSRSGSSS